MFKIIYKYKVILLLALFLLIGISNKITYMLNRQALGYLEVASNISVIMNVKIAAMQGMDVNVDSYIESLQKNNPDVINNTMIGELKFLTSSDESAMQDNKIKLEEKWTNEARYYQRLGYVVICISWLLYVIAGGLIIAIGEHIIRKVRGTRKLKFEDGAGI